MDAELTPADIDQLVSGADRKPGRGEDKPGDLRIGKKLIEFRTDFGFPRRTVAQACGISITSITRIELGQRMFSAHSLSGLLVGLRRLVRMINPQKVRAYERWSWEFLEVVYDVEEEQRIERRRVGKRPHTSERGKR